MFRKIRNEDKEKDEEITYLKNVILLRDREIKDIKFECAKEFEKIKNVCFSNEYNGKYDKLRKINEIAKDNFLALVNDLVILEEGKIIELPNTNQSKR